MRKIILLTIFTLIFLSTAARADQTSQRQAILKMLEITNTKSMTDQLMTGMGTMMMKQLEEAAADVPPEGREAVEAVRKDLMKWMADTFSWDQMKEMYVDIYTEAFSEDEIHELIGFYQSALGQKMLRKMPEIIRISLEKTQTMVQKNVPIFEANLQKTLADLKAKYSKKAGQNSIKPARL